MRLRKPNKTEIFTIIAIVGMIVFFNRDVIRGWFPIAGFSIQPKECIEGAQRTMENCDFSEFTVCDTAGAGCLYYNGKTEKFESLQKAKQRMAQEKAEANKKKK